MIVNLTPHPIRLYAVERADGVDDLDAGLQEVIEPTGPPARLATIDLGTCDGVEMVEFGHAHDLPPKRDGVRYVVSLVVAISLADRRSDLLVPYREVRKALAGWSAALLLAAPLLPLLVLTDRQRELLCVVPLPAVNAAEANRRWQSRC